LGEKGIFSCVSGSIIYHNATFKQRLILTTHCFNFDPIILADDKKTLTEAVFQEIGRHSDPMGFAAKDHDCVHWGWWEPSGCVDFIEK